MLAVFSRECLNLLERRLMLRRGVNSRAFSTLNEEHTAFEPETKADSRGVDNFRTFTSNEINRMPFADPYFENVHGNYLEAPASFGTNVGAEAPVLVRNNVGVGFLTLNGDWLSSGGIGTLCRELSDLETNVYKRLVVLTSMTRSVFSRGLNLAEVSLFFESYSKLSRLGKVSADLQRKMELIRKGLGDYLKNVCDLLYIIRTYKKPLLVYGNGLMEALGGSLCFVSTHSACYKHSTFQLNLSDRYFNCFGSTFLLSNLRGNLGEYLLLTNARLSGSDLIWAGLAKKFMDPSSLSNLQINSDRLTELPERYVETYMGEFKADVPDEFSLRKYQDVIRHHFRHATVSDIVTSLHKSYTKAGGSPKAGLSESEIRAFEESLIGTIQAVCRGTKIEQVLGVVKKLKVIRYKIISELGIEIDEWNEMTALTYAPPVTINQANMRLLHSLIMEVLLVESLSIELELFYRYPYLDSGLDAAHAVPADRVEYEFTDRSGMALSGFQKLRELHVDYNHSTRCEYDKKRQAELANRYRPDHLSETLALMSAVLDIRT